MRLNRKWLFAILLSAMLAMTLLVGCLRSDKATAQSGYNGQKKLTMVTSSEYPPYQYRDIYSGKDEIIGFNVDIAKYITKQLGYELEVIDTEAIIAALPALVNESIGMLKSSALLSTIGVQDLLRRSQIVGSQKYIFFEPLIFGGAIYYLTIVILTWSSYALERRLQRSS
jgi:ABC-type amino acid transport substrate-binding protein